MSGPQTVTADHLRRLACFYVRQSSLPQVQDNRESTARQYDLKRRAQAFGWPLDRIEIIDDDQGLSGASSVDRNGFQRLVADVGMGRVGLVMGLEVSRLARNSTDWHRLLEICALTETLILDEDGIYDPAHFNDRLLLGLKGTMSEAELHVLRARLIGGQINEARRGALWMRPPLGFVTDAHGQLALDPDAQIQGAVRLLFETFRRTGSACAVVSHFATEAQGVVVAPHQRRPEGRRGAGTAVSSPGADHPAQSAGCGRLRVRAHTAAESRAGGTMPPPAAAARRVEGLPPQCPSGVSDLGGLRSQSDDAPHECRGLRMG